MKTRIRGRLRYLTVIFSMLFVVAFYWTCARALQPQDSEERRRIPQAGRGLQKRRDVHAPGNQDRAESCTTLVRGRVSSGGAGVPHAQISVDTTNRISLAAYTDQAGSFSATVAESEFRIIAEADGFEMASTATIMAVPCRTVDVELTLPSFRASVIASDVRASIIKGVVETPLTETATIIARSRDGEKTILRTHGMFALQLKAAPPYYVYAEGPGWVTARTEIWDGQDPLLISNRLHRAKVLHDQLGRVWRFSSPAGVYFMEMEATVPEFDECIAAGACVARNTVSKISDMPPCASAKQGPADCVTRENAQLFCRHIDARLPTPEEWRGEYTDAGRRLFPWGNAPPDCSFGNIAVSRSGMDSVPSIFVQPCSGRRAVRGCSYPAGRSISGLCDMSGNMGEWTSEPVCGLGVPLSPPDDLGLVCLGFESARSGIMGVRCVRDLDVRKPWDE
jgi:hypothetical protein